MSLYGAMSAAISGLTAQSAAFGNISGNVANSQTVGFKRVDTSFVDYLDTSTPTENEPGAVVARPDYVNNVQGTVSHTDNPLAMAINGQGFFQVSQSSTTNADGSPVFGAQAYYTRAGDFQLDKNGYLENSAGDYLNGWVVPAGQTQLDKSQLTEIKVSQAIYKPVQTSAVSLAANLPTGYTQATDASGNVVVEDASGKPTSPPSSQVDIYDSQGTPHQLNLTWTPLGTATTPSTSWSVDVSVANGSGGSTDMGTIDVAFGPDGTISSVAADPKSAATVTPTGTQTSGAPATVSLTAPFTTAAAPTQPIKLSLGTFGQTDGVTQFSGADYSLRGINQDGVPPGAYSSLTVKSTGDVYVNYDNGQSRLIARVPVTTFPDPTGLQSQNGASFTSTLASGNPVTNDAANNGAGALVTSSTESSNVDTATELTQLIVAQQAYSANAKVITTANTLMQTTIDMIR